MKRALVAAAALLGLASAQVTLTGAGATFPAPLYTEKYIPTFSKLANVKINYQAVGSGGGQRQLLDKVVQFAGSDAPLTDAQMKEYQDKTGSAVLHIPAALGPVAITYNLPGVNELRLDADTLAAIYLGKIVRWNDPRIAALNPGVNLPRQVISAVHRSDGSGTTYIFTAYLSAISAEWKSKVGQGTAVNWPAFSSLANRGNAGVAGLVQKSPGAVGYVELAYALENNLPIASVKNAAGNFVKPSLASAKEAAEGVDLPNDLRLVNQVVNTKDPAGYPIVGMTWLLVFQKQEVTAKSREQAKAVVDFLNWVITDGQELNESLKYVRLSPKVVNQAKALIATITYNGQKL
ncbi:Phosphate-binding protein PstS [Calidithermus terrae]|uniref:Phosphate-binding protein n=1 Tax=Calidithermus terrae TaxID=1408545 RepID=A0A399E938_9DEIN|nr:phosphate ABC transporter substrate-binding protein PstS [Calidithermus terrae]RIH81234.1 Phosphate-binding protein PstS [Calidithermus terrae]